MNYVRYILRYIRICGQTETAKRCFERAKEFDISVTVEKYNEVYEAIYARNK